MIFSVDRMQPDPAKINALNFITAPTNRNDFMYDSVKLGLHTELYSKG